MDRAALRRIELFRTCSESELDALLSAASEVRLGAGDALFGERETAWTREFFAALGRFREGVYVNFLGGDEDPSRVREAYGDAVYDRLLDVKTTYDPDNVFHHNQNIRPRLTSDV